MLKVLTTILPLLVANVAAAEEMSPPAVPPPPPTHVTPAPVVPRAPTPLSPDMQQQVDQANVEIGLSRAFGEVAQLRVDLVKAKRALEDMKALCGDRCARPADTTEKK